MRNIEFCLNYLVVADQQAYRKQTSKPHPLLKKSNTLSAGHLDDVSEQDEDDSMMEDENFSGEESFSDQTESIYEEEDRRSELRS